MTRPEIIRADSIDLQDRDAPSAKNHQARPSPLQTSQSASGPVSGTGNVAPHQAETLREVAAGQAEEELHSPRVSWVNGEPTDIQQYAEDLAAGVTSSLNGQKSDSGQNMAANSQQDNLAVAQNGGLVSQGNTDDGDLDEDEDLDDDMMDKISSSPSIDDGGSTCQLPSFDCFRPDASPCSSPTSACLSEARSSSPYLEQPDYLPIQHNVQNPSRVFASAPTCHHHLPGATPTDNDEKYDVVGRREIEEIGVTGKESLERDGQSETHDTNALVVRAAMPVAEEDGIVEKTTVEQDKSTDEAVVFVDDEDDDISDLIVPYEDCTDEDDDDDFSLEFKNPRFVDSGWGGECLHENAEDIDFELVYALHTFIATVEGQANATKGDAMVLLDDSNSYWWLVRVVKDSSIGYLPAEHIETPTERLARLNKHRNIDLAATMLGDQAEKAKNPLKTAMRRRKAKNVTFAAPTYVDYSDFDYDSDEDEEVDGEGLAQKQQSQQQASTAKQTNDEEGAKQDEESAKVAPLRPRAQKSVQVVEPAKAESEEPSPSKSVGRTSEEIFETNGVEGPKKRADGTVRDSFFKDDTVETKKITLTPNLLRDDGTVRGSSDSIERSIKQRPSLDKLEKDPKEDRKKGRDKKDKDKKGGFRSLFSRKDKKQRGDEDDDAAGKRSMDATTEASERQSEDVDDLDKSGAVPQRSASKLQKQQARVEPSPARKPGGMPREASNAMDLSTFLNEGKLKNVSSVPPASMRVVDPDADLSDDGQKSQSAGASRSASMDDYRPAVQKQAPPRSQSFDEKPVKVTPAKTRMPVDDSDSEEDVPEEPVAQPAVTKEAAPDRPQDQPQVKLEQQQTEQMLQRPSLPGAFPDSYISAQSTESTSTVTAEKAAATNKQQPDRLSESPIEVSPITPTESQPPALSGDTSSQEDHSSPVSSPSPDLIDRDEAAGAHQNQDSISTSTSTPTVATWNNHSLRAFFDSGTDIRDLIAVVYDKNDIEPVGPDHPVAGALFKEQNAKLAEITTQLDNMLGDWLARKQRLRGTV